jgi:hypothetical protein
MAKQLGPTFGYEVIDAGLGLLPFVWGATDDTITGRENLTGEQNDTLDAVIAAHDPTDEPPPVVTVDDVMLFEQENRVRALEGEPALTLDAFVEKKARTKIPGRPRV